MNKSVLITASIMLAVGVGLGYWLSPQNKEGNQSNTAVSESNQKVLFYRNSMNPSVTSPVPAKDSMGMDYKAVYADEAGNNESSGTVSIDPVVVQNIGVRTAIAKRQALSRTVRAVGRVDFDEKRIARLHPKIDGWIEQIFVDKTGEQVKAGEMLLGIYSPRLVSTQQEYLLALKNLDTLNESPFEDIRKGALDLVKSSRERLQLFDVPEHQIKELEKTRKVKKIQHIETPVDGTVIRIGARQGQYVTPKTELYTVVDLDIVWVYADIYEYELPWVKVGDSVEMTLASVPGKVFAGKLAYIYPYAESKTRTTQVRIIFDNSESLLRPDMFSEVQIGSDTIQNALVIPAESIIRSGEYNQVFVVRSAGKYEPKKVELGFESQGLVAVLSGIEEGDQVVTSAQFLLDSESKLREATAKFTEITERNNDNRKADKPVPEKEMDEQKQSLETGNTKDKASSSSDVKEESNDHD